MLPVGTVLGEGGSFDRRGLAPSRMPLEFGAKVVHAMKRCGDEASMIYLVAECDEAFFHMLE